MLRRFSSKQMRDARAAVDQATRPDPKPHVIEIDERGYRDDVAYQAYCVECSWAGKWYHSEDYDGSLDRPFLEAQTDGAVHLAATRIAEAAGR